MSALGINGRWLATSRNTSTTPADRVDSLEGPANGAGSTTLSDVRYASRTRGDITYIGQLEDDLADLLDELDRRGAPAHRVLIGHSSGGGFALRVAALPLSSRFIGTILLSRY